MTDSTPERIVTSGKTGLISPSTQVQTQAPLVTTVEWTIEDIRSFLLPQPIPPSGRALKSPPLFHGGLCVVLHVGTYADRRAYVRGYTIVSTEGPELQDPAATLLLAEGLAPPFSLSHVANEQVGGGQYVVWLELHNSTTTSMVAIPPHPTSSDLGYCDDWVTSGRIKNDSVTLVLYIAHFPSNYTMALTFHRPVLTTAFGTLVTHMQNLLKVGTHADVMLHFNDGVERSAHKAVLAARSSIFKTLFQSSFREKHEDVVEVAMPSRVGDILLEFLYTGSLVALAKLKTLDDLLILYEAAEYYHVSDLAHYAARQTAPYLKPDNFLHVAAVARRHARLEEASGMALLAVVRDYFVLHIDTVVEHVLKNDSGGHLDPAEVILILGRLKTMPTVSKAQ
jgi:hypothetical protein